MIKRRKTYQAKIGHVSVGGEAPIRVQSMTNTDTTDISSTVIQVKQLADAGSELVRITVNNEESAKSVQEIHKQLIGSGYHIPIIGDFHYNGHRLLKEYPECAKVLAKYRINPGNVGFGKKKNSQFQEMIEIAIEYDKPVRIGVNWGSLDQDLLTKLMNENSKKQTPDDVDLVMREALIQSALISAETAENIGLKPENIIISCKVSKVQNLIATYEDLAKRCEYPLHLGLTEAGMGEKGIVASAAALSVLMQQGIGDTIRISLTPAPTEPRTKEVLIAQELLQSMGFRAFTPQVTACPGCGRTTSIFFQELAEEIQKFLRKQMPIWHKDFPGVEKMDVAVMGCIVNGPGESKHANIGISLPGTGESPAAPVFIDGEKAMTLRGENIAADFTKIIEDYVIEKYGVEKKTA